MASGVQFSLVPRPHEITRNMSEACTYCRQHSQFDGEQHSNLVSSFRIQKISIKLEFSWQIFEKSSNIKFNENPFSGSRVVPYRRINMMKLTVIFLNVSNAPKNHQIFWRNNCVNKVIQIFALLIRSALNLSHFISYPVLNFTP
jgi:hypothetical protein